LDAYAHFTSPIRRYADVIAHRQLVAALARREGEGDATVDVPYPTTTTTSSSSSSLSRASLTSTATHLNERNRASKRAQTKCAELYLLKVLQTAPAIEPALVIEVKDDGVVVFLPRFHVRGAVRLRRASREDGTSTVALPAKETVFEEETSGTRAGGQVRSIHWSPYDRVRVVNADP
jgi:DIS3-like exonuclease 1